MTLEDILQEVEHLKDALTTTQQDPAQEPETVFCSPEHMALAQALIRFRRKREAVFGPGLFADPAWDMLLDLFVAREQGRNISVSSLCIAAAVPPTTALRWIRHMDERGLLERRKDPRDGRRVWIAIKAEVHKKMRDLLAGSPIR